MSKSNQKAKLQPSASANTSPNRENKTSRNNRSNRGKQGRKDSDAKRVNFDNERESKFVRQYEKRGMRVKSADHANDISWYSRNPELLKSAASLPFNSVLGQQIWANSQAYVPGVMAIDFTFSYGSILNSANANGLKVSSKFYPEAINQAGKSMYSFLVHANSRNYVYEYQDLSMVIFAGVQVFAALAHVIRAYGIAKTYSEKSLYKPEAYLLAMGFNPTDFRKNLGQVWFDINQLISQTSQIWIPSEMPLIKRWIWMCSNIFTDADTALGQTYVFCPVMFQQFSETGDSKGTSLEPATYQGADGKWYVFYARGNKNNATNNGHLWSDWVAVIQHMIDRLVASEDRGIMFGDILNAYGAERIFALPSVPVETRIEPVFNPEVLTQIENLTTTRARCLGVRQDESGIYPLLDLPDSTLANLIQRVAPESPILNFHQQAQPTPEQIVVATRLTAAGSRASKLSYTTTNQGNASESAAPVSAVGYGGTSAGVLPLAFGSELVDTFKYVAKDATATYGWNIVDYPWAATLDQNRPMFSLESSVSGEHLTFDWAPFIYYLEAGTDAANTTEGAVLGKVQYAYGDYDNYTKLDYYELSKLHQMALMSEFGLPII